MKHRNKKVGPSAWMIFGAVMGAMVVGTMVLIALVGGGAISGPVEMSRQEAIRNAAAEHRAERATAELKVRVDPDVFTISPAPTPTPPPPPKK